MTTLFAALDIKSGKVIGECMNRHRHQENLRLLRTIDRNTPQEVIGFLIAAFDRRIAAGGAIVVSDCAETVRRFGLLSESPD